MKTLLIAALALAGLGLSTPQASAECYVRPVYCAPHKVATYEIARCSYCRTGYDACGRCFHYTVTVVTYSDAYSNGTSVTYTRSYRS